MPPCSSGTYAPPPNRALSFHPSKGLLAASVIDGTAWLWNIADPEHPTHLAVLTAAELPLHTATFRPSGDLLVASGSEGIVHTWRTGENAVIAGICATAGDPITEQEWRAHLPELPYDPPC